MPPLVTCPVMMSTLLEKSDTILWLAQVIDSDLNFLQWRWDYKGGREREREREREGERERERKHMCKVYCDVCWTQGDVMLYLGTYSFTFKATNGNVPRMKQEVNYFYSTSIKSNYVSFTPAAVLIG